MAHFEQKTKISCLPQFIVISFLPLVFLVGLVIAFLGYFSLKVDMHTLAIVGFIFITFVTFVKHNANYAVCYMRGSFIKMEQELQDALRNNALTILGNTKSTLHVQDFISEYYKTIRSDNFARVAPSVFPMLGILGTFVAIALSMPDFSAKDSSALDREISVLLSGIGTAFYASIYGIMLSLIWTYFEKRGMAKIENDIYALERLYGKRVWKESELIKHQHMQSELKDQQIVQTLKDTFNMDFVKELNEQYIQNFTKIIEDTSHSFTKLTGHMQDASGELRNTLEKIETKKGSLEASTRMESMLKNFNGNMQSLETSMNRFDGSVEHTFDAIDKELGEAVKKLTLFASIISEQNQLILKNMITHNKQEK